MKGYTQRMGRVVTKMQAAFSPSELTILSASPAREAISVSSISLEPVMMIRRRTTCRVNMLRQESADHVVISRTSGQLTDYFDPRTDTLRLSDGVYGSASVAALGIAAHEAGHALQKQQGYPFLSLRSLMVPAVNIGSTLAWPIFVLGLIFSWDPLVNAGIVLFGLVVLFSLVTLPVEFDASRRAMAMLAGSGYLTQDEQKGVKAVLSAAALTYVASFVSALLQLFRLITIARRRD